MYRAATLGLCALLALTACKRRESAGTPPAAQRDTVQAQAPADAAAPEPVALGLYRATLALPGGELPFGLEIVREDHRHVAYLINGSDRVRVPEVEAEAGRIEMRMPGFENRLLAAVDGTALRGEVVMVKRGGHEQHIPFAARLGEAHRFDAEPLSDNADVSGRWAVTFTTADGKKSPAVGEFRQVHHEVNGTILTTTGDHRYLAGEVRGDELALSKFDGGHAFLYRAHVNLRGELEGTFWSGLASRETFVARRNEAASIGEAEAVTQMRANAERLQFSFPDLNGKLVNLSDARFNGKVVIVALAGSWCPNCHDEAAFLAPYYLTNRQRGLEVVSLMFEHFGDFPQAVAATRRFRDRYDIAYTTLIAGTSDRDDAAKRLPQLNGVYAFPTTLFVDRQGRVRHIHTGFSGPATGERFERLKESFDATVEQLLNETGEAAATRSAAG